VHFRSNLSVSYRIVSNSGSIYTKQTPHLQNQKHGHVNTFTYFFANYCASVSCILSCSTGPRMSGWSGAV